MKVSKAPNSPQQLKHWKPTLHSLTTNDVLEISVKLKFQCFRFKRRIVYSGGFELVSYLFLLGYFQQSAIFCKVHFSPNSEQASN